ncbi:glycosyltransferase family 2 protein [Candidatus Roizmanbacteria bacterium]|nr:glycosyltransferase family 2 protein [Candidatus Roizmanbacteria bacterium]
MKIAFIFVCFHTPEQEKKRLEHEVKQLNLNECQLYFPDNTNTGLGYAAGVNQGIREALKDRNELFVIANTDISLKEVTGAGFIAGGKHFDVWGFAMNQNKIRYYGGEIDPLRYSGGLITRKPTDRFVPVDYVTGSLMVIKSTVIETIGVWDESYHMYYEDVDYCVRTRKGGFKVGIDAKMCYEHFESSQKRKEKDIQLARSRVKFLIKHGTLKAKMHELLRLPKTLYEERQIISKLGRDKLLQ